MRYSPVLLRTFGALPWGTSGSYRVNPDPQNVGVPGAGPRSGHPNLDRASNVEIGVECQIFGIVISFNWGASFFYNKGDNQGIIRVH